MKIAYVFTGHLRTFRQNSSIVPMLLERHPGDVFLQTFSTRNFDGNKWHRDHAGAGELVTQDDLDWLSSTYPGVVVASVTTATSGADLLAPEHAGMGFRVARELGCQVRREYENATGKQYDLVFLARYDLGFREPVTLPDQVDPYTLYGGYNANQERQGNDGEVFVYGSPHVIDSVMCPAIPHMFAEQVPEMGYVGEKLMTLVRKSLAFDYEPHRVRHFLYRDQWQMDVESC